MKQIYLLLIIIGVMATDTFAQSGRQHTPLYDLSNTRYLNKGWHFAPGITYMLPANDELLNTRLIVNDGEVDTLYTGEFNPGGRIGLHLEVGRHHLVDFMYLLDNIDYGLGFKMLRGTEEFVGTVRTGDIMTPTENSASFSQSFVTGFAHFGNIHQLSDRMFLHSSFGLNADFRLFGSTPFEGNYNHMNWEFPERFIGQMNFRFGVGFKMEQSWFVVPSIETPILNIVTFDDGKSTLQYFSNRYRPLIITLRFMRLDKRKSPDCVGKSDGTSGHSLWGGKMGKKYRKR